MDPVTPITPVIRISSVVFFETLSMMVIEMEVPAPVVIPAVVTRIVAMHVAVVVAVLSVSRAGTQRESEYRD